VLWLSAGVTRIEDTPVHIQTKIHRYLVFCEQPDSYDTDAAPDDVRGDSVLDASVMRGFALRTSQKSTGTWHLANSLTATTLTQRLMICAAILFSTLLLYAGLPSALARRKDTREGRQLQHISCKRWYRSHVVVASSERCHRVEMGCTAGCTKGTKAERRRLNVAQAAAAAMFKRKQVWKSCAKG
jgi:hypothetical protein